MVENPSKFEKSAIKSIHEWKNPKIGWLGETMKTVNWPLGKASALITKAPGVNWVIEKAIGGLVGLLNDFAHWTVNPEAIYKRYRNSGFKHIKEPKDIFSLDLEEIDRVIGWLDTKYKTIATVEGAGSGYVGLPGIPADIISLIALNQRAIAEYATYFGFDINSQQERLFALNVLALASSPKDVAKQVAMAQLVRIAQDAAKIKTWKNLEQKAFVKVIRIIARSLGVRLTKAKLAQIVPVAGAVVGAGFNAYYTNKVCDAAFFLYRERFLAEKYGSDIIDIKVAPADTFEPNFGDEKVRVKIEQLEKKVDQILGVLKPSQEDIGIIKSTHETEEEKLKEIYEATRKQISSLKNQYKKDINIYEGIVKNQIENWDKLDSLSKEILPQAEYLFLELAGIENADYSPVILQYCKSLENEISKKLFIEFTFFVGKKYEIIDVFLKEDFENDKTKKFAKYIKGYKDKNSEDIKYTLGDMNFILGFTSGKNTIEQSPLLREFKEFIVIRDKDKHVISKEYLRRVSSIVDIRNKCAHPNKLTEIDAVDYKKEIPKDINDFISHWNE